MRLSKEVKAAIIGGAFMLFGTIISLTYSDVKLLCISILRNIQIKGGETGRFYPENDSIPDSLKVKNPTDTIDVILVPKDSSRSAEAALDFLSIKAFLRRAEEELDSIETQDSLKRLKAIQDSIATKDSLGRVRATQDSIRRVRATEDSLRRIKMIQNDHKRIMALQFDFNREDLMGLHNLYQRNEISIDIIYPRGYFCSKTYAQLLFESFENYDLGDFAYVDSVDNVPRYSDQDSLSFLIVYRKGRKNVAIEVYQYCCRVLSVATFPIIVGRTYFEKSISIIIPPLDEPLPYR